jgi:molybdopterin molybdotransferase
MLPIEDALRIVDESLADALLPSERVLARKAEGRVLRSDQASRLDLPPFDKSRMDGYAVRADDPHEAYRLLETVAAGRMGQHKLEPGTTVKVMTGAPVPEGAARVIVVEEAEERDNLVRFRRGDGPTNIVPRAQDVRRGDVILKAGTVLGAVEIANLISCGITEVEVSRRPRFAVLATGNEITDDPEDLRPGRIMNSNGPLLAGLADRYGLETVIETIVTDDVQATARALDDALDRSDLVALSGGVSAGDFDCVLAALSQSGLEVRFARVAVKPGKPTVFAQGRGRAVFGLPGNPVAVFLAFHFFVRRAAARMTGSRDPLRTLRLPLAAPFRRRKGERREHVPARLSLDGRVEAVPFHGSAHLAGLLEADGIFVVPRGVTGIPGGELVEFIPLRMA